MRLLLYDRLRLAKWSFSVDCDDRRQNKEGLLCPTEAPESGVVLYRLTY